MKTYFGEFLVEQELITRDDLCTALMVQISKIPSEIELAYSSKLLNTEQILDIIKFQFEHQCDFSTAADNLKLNSESLQASIVAAEQKFRIPFGQILIEQKKIDHAKLNAAFDEYLSLRKDEHLDPKQTNKMVNFSSAKELVSANPVNDREGTFTKEILALDLSLINHDMLSDFLEVLEEGKKSELELIMLGWEPLNLADATDRKTAESSMRVLYREYHTLKGTSRFIGGLLTEYIVHRVEDLLSTVMNNLERCPTASLSRLSGLNLRVLDCIWDIRTSLQVNGDEKSVVQDAGKLRLISELIADVTSMNSEMKSTVGTVDLDSIAANF